jgi:cytochrome c-type biogenesis protein CcmH
MTAFILVAALLVIAVLAILLPPLWRSPGPSSSADQREANLAIFRDQLGELERDRDAGSLAAADFEQARSELQRRLLDEAAVAIGRRAPAPRAAARTAMALTPSLLPLAPPQRATHCSATRPRSTRCSDRRASGSRSRSKRCSPAGRKAARKTRRQQGLGDAGALVQGPRTLPGSCRSLSSGRRAGRSDPALLADYAEVLSEVNGGKLQGRPSELIAQALKIDPDEPQALLLAGAAASERQQYAAAADHWARLLTQVETGSDEAKALAAAISRARGMAAQQANGTATSKAVAGAGKVSGEVALSGKLAGQARPDDVLFVFARAEEGSRMPLAATRATVAELPLRFALDDAMALAGGRKISDFASVSVEARIVKAGQAQSSSGDLFGTLTGVKPGSQNLRLLIDQVQP